MMNWGRNDWTVYVIVLALTVAVLAGGQLLWHKYAIAKPLDTRLQQIQGVTMASWEDSSPNSDRLTLTITLGQVDNLEKTYREIAATAENILGRKSFSIVLHDQRTPQLENLFYHIQYAVQEAIFTGKFTAMADRINAQAAAAGAKAKVYVDSRDVYIQLSKGTGRLYTVIPRRADRQGVK